MQNPLRPADWRTRLRVLVFPNCYGGSRRRWLKSLASIRGEYKIIDARPVFFLTLAHFFLMAEMMVERDRGSENILIINDLAHP